MSLFYCLFMSAACRLAFFCRLFCWPPLRFGPRNAVKRASQLSINENYFTTLVSKCESFPTLPALNFALSKGPHCPAMKIDWSDLVFQTSFEFPCAHDPQVTQLAKLDGGISCFVSAQQISKVDVRPAFQLQPFDKYPASGALAFVGLTSFFEPM